MGWLQLVGSLKLQVSFAKEPYKKEIYSAKETYNSKEPTNRSHPMGAFCIQIVECRTRDIVCPYVARDMTHTHF